MSNFIPPRFPFGRGPSPFYLCECPKCGLRQSYELGDPSSVIVNGEEDPDSMKIRRLPEMRREMEEYPHAGLAQILSADAAIFSIRPSSASASRLYRRQT